ncbi:hypothetical protein NEMIN01_0546 [Nematocida minor]|uniref:uncharacterized protein n=1 Tax=Nematocida minor TaxID=1912983 RepID=UPI002220A910|nr:uncharacterized protein NEMIN01_0546 [Nematocida minor]KAI5189483.1 hypothetical protein NEMIN01_0546 [Nematocida minor]
MILFKNILFLAVIFCSFSQIDAVGEHRENPFFSEHISGYLFNVGQKSYISFYKHRRRTYPYADPDRTVAAKLQLRIITDRALTHAIFISDSYKDLKACRHKHSHFDSGSAKQYERCRALQVREKKNVLTMDRYNKHPTFSFLISAPVLPKYHAFRIIHDNKCLTVKGNGQLDMEECNYHDMFKRTYQFFVWVEESLFNKNYNPMVTIDQSENPSNPYYIRGIKQTIWKK